MNATDSVVDFIANTSLQEIPQEARHLGKRAILDTLGVTMAGAADEGVRILVETLRDRQGKPVAGVVGAGTRTDCLSAALLNGTMAHALDFDDVNDSIMGHPSAPLVPAIMSLGEELGASGAQVLEAFLVGFEVECKLGLAVGKSHYVKGWHATSTLGCLGAAAAAAKLMGLDTDRIRMAMGIATSLSNGLRVNFGTMTKPLHVGEAARNGLLAALLAQKDFTSSADHLDHPLGFCQVYSSDDGGSSRLVGTMGSPWEILSTGIVVKKYPCCNNTHRTLDASLAIFEESHPSPDEIDRVEVITPPGEDMSLIYSLANTGLEGKFCMQFCVASALIDGKVDPDTFAEAQVQRPHVQELSRKVKVIYDHDQEPVVVDSGGFVVVRVVMKDGQEHESRAEQAKGSPFHPLTDEEIKEKYTSCARTLLDPDQINRSIDLVYALEDLPDIRELMEMVCLTSPVESRA